QQLGAEQGDARAPGVFCPEERGIRGPQEGRGFTLMIGVDAGAAADADSQLAILDQQRPVKCAYQGIAEFGHPGWVAGVFLDDGELVPAETSRETAGTGCLAQSLRDPLQHQVAE